jgi:hypothetical protein
MMRLYGQPQPGVKPGQSAFNGDGSPLLYWGGPVMGTVSSNAHQPVHIHLIFWQPAGTAKEGQISTIDPNMETDIERYFSDVAADPSHSVFAVDGEYGDSSGTGSTGVVFTNTPNVDVIQDTNAFPAFDPSSEPDQGCPTPVVSGSGSSCYTDFGAATQVQDMITAHSLPTGLGNLYILYVAPGANSCFDDTIAVCGATAISGSNSIYCAYHSSISTGPLPSDEIIYANMPMIGVASGSNGCIVPGYPAPNDTGAGNLGAIDSMISISSHEANESITDPFGSAWFDDLGFENGDKCAYEDGPPLGGTAANGDSFNQHINGHDYQTQLEFSNNDLASSNKECVGSDQTSATPHTSTPLGLPSLASINRYSGAVSGTGFSPTQTLHIALQRGSHTIATATPTTAGNGSWSASVSGGHVLGDSRDTLNICDPGVFACTGTTSPTETFRGLGGLAPPFLGSGELPLDAGDALATLKTVSNTTSVTLSQCFYPGIATIHVTGPHAESVPVPTGVSNCVNGANTFQLPDGFGPGDQAFIEFDTANSFLQNPSGTPFRYYGDLATTAPLGQSGAGGPATCHADLVLKTVRCSGLADGSYTLSHTPSGHSAVSHTVTVSNGRGAFTFAFSASEPLSGGDTLSVTQAPGAGGLTLTTLHVASLKLDVNLTTKKLTGGTCAPLEWFGPEDPSSATEPLACPLSGSVKGLSLPTSASGRQPLYSNYDELSGGRTSVAIPAIADMIPASGQVVTGSFNAYSDATRQVAIGANTRAKSVATVTLSLTRLGRSTPAYTSGNTNKAVGAKIPALPAGRYTTAWTITDAHGDQLTINGTLTIEPG